MLGVCISTGASPARPRPSAQRRGSTQLLTPSRDPVARRQLHARRLAHIVGRLNTFTDRLDRASVKNVERQPRIAREKGVVDAERVKDNYYQSALQLLRFVEHRTPTTRRFGEQADAAWKQFCGALKTSDRIQLMIALCWSSACSDRALPPVCFKCTANSTSV